MSNRTELSNVKKYIVSWEYEGKQDFDEWQLDDNTLCQDFEEYCEVENDKNEKIIEFIQNYYDTLEDGIDYTVTEQGFYTIEEVEQENKRLEELCNRWNN